MDRVAEIKALYHQATRATIARDLARAVELLTLVESEAERERAAVYMDGLSQMRSEWASAPKPAVGRAAPARPARRARPGAGASGTRGPAPKAATRGRRSGD